MEKNKIVENTVAYAGVGAGMFRRDGASEVSLGLTKKAGLSIVNGRVIEDGGETRYRILAQKRATS